MKLTFFIFLIGFIGNIFNVQQGESILPSLQEAFDRNQPPGAVVIWVQSDSVIIHNRFGYANLEERREIDPGSTLFRIGSISKPFTAIAVLNAVEKGLLELDKDINHYFENGIVKNGSFQPITLRHLLTHTPGFDDFYIGKSARTRDEAISLAEVIEAFMPKRRFEPGEIASYSNFGVALAGYVLEHVDGRSFPTILKEDVFMPLGMINSSFDPEENALQNFMTGYHRNQEGLNPLTYDYILDAPAGTMVSTMNDMERFMKLILKPNGLESFGVLSQEMQQEMLSLQFTHHHGLNGGIGYLWSHIENNNHSVIAHDGGYLGTAARLFLFPDDNAAMFVTLNIMEFGFINDVTELLTKTFLSSDSDDVEFISHHRPIADGRSISDFAGIWRNTRYSKHSFTKFAVLLGMMGQEIKTEVVSDTLLTMPMLSGEPRRMVRVEPLMFQSIDDDYRIAFRESNGKITHLFTGGANAFERISLIESQFVQLIILVVSTLFFLLCAIYYPVYWLIRKFQKKEKPVLRIFKIEMGISLLFTTYLLLLLIMFASIPDYEFLIGFGYGLPASIYFITLIPYAAMLLAIYLGYSLVLIKNISVHRLAYSLLFLTITLINFISLWYWNSIGWNF